MSGELNVPPDLLAKFEDLVRRVYELERRRIEGSGSGVDATDPILFITPNDGDGSEYRAYLGTTRSNAAEFVVSWGDFNPATPTTPFPDLASRGSYLDAIVTEGNTYIEELVGPNGTGFWEHFLIRYDADRTGGGMDGYSENDAGSRYAGGEITATTKTFTDHASAFIGTDVNDDDAGTDAFLSIDMRSSDSFEWRLPYTFADTSELGWYFGTTGGGGAASIAFGLFDQVGSPSTQAAAIDMSAESAAVQAIYDALRAYGWFGP